MQINNLPCMLVIDLSNTLPPNSKLLLNKSLLGLKQPFIDQSPLISVCLSAHHVV